ncbi:MAG: FAD-dependent oxidoreductase [Ignavibacteriaceae bacterium]|nr:FAD-dependent oxidoreductase [Ignavibacteriaceae bacterium]
METITTDVLVVGGGCGGSAAGIQSARLGAKTIIIEETPWPGGMITAAGVSAFDGNKYAVGGGIFGELRKMIEDYYGGPERTFTGWISLTCFEPVVGKNFIMKLIDAEKNLTFMNNTRFVSAVREDNRITGVIARSPEGKEFRINAKVVIEATEYGDVLKSAGVPYRIGRDTKSDTGEPDATEIWDAEVQDVTFCAILKKYDGKAPQVSPSPNYNPERFINSTSVHSDSTDEKYLNHKLHDWNSFITYAALPNDKYLLNWPFRSNDYPTTLDLYEDAGSREEHYRKAKELTLDFIHYIQTRLGHPEWGLATDEFPTQDALPFIPYVRESRRVKGLRLMKEEDVVPADGSYRPPLQKDSIAVGDYFLDHHHSKFFVEPENRISEDLPDNAPFQIPMGTLIPESCDGLVCAEKSISITHIVNGCTRLQPAVMLTGQAAGALAAISAIVKKQPSEIEHGAVQKTLLDAGCQLFPYKDVWNTNPHFRAVQELAIHGLYIDKENFDFGGWEKISSDNIEKWKKASLANNLNIPSEVFDSLPGRTRYEAAEIVWASLNQK